MENILIAVALLFAFINGFHDGCNVIATIVTSRSLSPRHAILIACAAEFLGVLILGEAVAATIGRGILTTDVFHVARHEFNHLILAALIGGISWNLFTWFVGLPSSSSHALIGGLVGASVAVAGLDAVLWRNFFYMVLVPLLVAPLLGFVGGFIIMKISRAFLENRKPNVVIVLKKLQIFSMIFLACGHGSNDAQKSMGIIALVLGLSMSGEFSLPRWVVLSCALAISLGLSLGGWKIIKTVGKQVYKMTPLHSFDSQVSSGMIIYFCSLMGFPVSTTQTVGSSVMGSGAGFKIRSVRWEVTRDIITAWCITIPAAGLIAALCYMVLNLVSKG